ncbi:D-serine deaminase-like pyridoxal phosphate-dependent protein [Barrientosiimonas humi]|uniref:D-serine deaminase-like pyridoxal phosphate-dependent protein n=1 Tax=Barrientosiimonas humi TaxID=999931 RepID=A0A542XGM7_9MICO|nr:amino acid deaminase [Barrientosiimonas humi]TQL34981.1 D-serine deaminase-like pyridoxal phosphate-dependent protein [Barrientosiimonas humi]CAG7571193.1 D-threonine aldolase [Barrientosiimonas humi]
MPHQLTGRPEGPLSATDKALPPQADGLTAEQFLATAPRLSSLATPLLTLSEPAIAANVETLAAWSSDHGIALSPHGKTTMSPVLWRRQLEAGAHSITVANYPQLRVAVAAGVRCIQVANDLVDPAALRWLTEAVDTDPELEVMVWADSLESVAVLREHFTGNRPLTVLAELGGAHGRTGARSVEVAVAIGRALAEAGNLRLGGVAGYEGALAHDPTPEAVAAVDAFLRRMAATHQALHDAGSYPADGEIVLTAGGSAYFDRVAAVLAPLASDRVRVVIRSGAYVIHDSGFYTAMTPFARTDDGATYHLTPAMTAWARVVSRPEPGLALLDVGKRDVSFDEGMPTVLGVAAQLGAPRRELEGAQVTAVNDQHAFVQLPAEADLAVGEVVALGLSHPCTALDKWRTIPVLADDSDDPVVADLLTTYF